ncbi:hypothetical protein [uncultured Mailhella sp.]|nr:hypothetical protein [uncultured Mailhella sp.]
MGISRKCRWNKAEDKSRPCIWQMVIAHFSAYFPGAAPFFRQRPAEAAA